MQALLSDGPLEGRTIGVDTGAEGKPPHTIDVDVNATRWATQACA
jgi:hypothetical protein